MLIEETHLRPNLHHLIPPWPPEPTSPSIPTTANYDTLLSSLRQTLFSYSPTSTAASADDSGNLDYFPAEDDDEFFMYEFKVRNCTRPRAHDWTECPFAHPGEKARRRDPRKYNYSGNSCSDFRKGGCQKGDKCEFSHGVFESWLHPSKFRTQACKDGPGCTRRVCFFAHSPDQLRAGSGLNLSPNPNSEPSLFDRRDQRVGGVGEVLKALSKMSLQLNKVKSLPKSWGSTVPHVGSGPIFGSPMMTGIGTGHTGRVGFFSLPTTPTQPIGAGRKFVLWDNAKKEEEVAMERVESGRELRARMFDKLNKENSFNGSGFGSESNPVEGSGSGPDVGWISDLLTSLE